MVTDLSPVEIVESLRKLSARLVVVPGDDDVVWEEPRIVTRHTHGTGCTLSSAIATALAQGAALPDAVARARTLVRAALLAAPGLGKGHGPMGHAALVAQ